jgi:hypothetical protein
MIMRNPKTFPKNIHYYKSLTTIIKEGGNCITVRCRNCPFSINYGEDCFIGKYFKPYNDAHLDNKLYYSAILLSLYTEAEVLTMLIQGEFNGTNA